MGLSYSVTHGDLSSGPGDAFSVASNAWLFKRGDDFYTNARMKWRIDSIGFRFGSNREPTSKMWIDAWCIPHWSIVAPLTLLSTWLLLSKPSQSMQKKITKPVSNEGTLIMGDFFRGSRRKIGCTTLLVALILMVGWVRSFARWDVIELNSWPRRVGIASSFNGDLLFYLASVNAREILFWPSVSLGPSFISKEAFLKSSDVVTVTWRWDWAAFHLTDRMHGDVRYQMLIVPYWCVVPPLTLFSAVLLFSKPHKSSQNKFTEPIPKKAA